MLAIQRKTEILNLIKKHKVVKVTDLSERFDTSEVTIRKDLSELEEEKLLKRTHGGAIEYYDPSFEPNIYDLEKMNIEEKVKIAMKAYEYIRDNDSLILGSSTTVQELADLIAKGERKNLMVMTNSITCAEVLLENKNIEVVLIGGSIQKNSMSMTGYWVNKVLNEIKVDKAFIGINGIHLDNGFTTPKFDVCEVKRSMLKSANQTFVLSDSSKLEQVALAKVADISEVDYLIIDEGITEEQAKQMSEGKIKLIIA